MHNLTGQAPKSRTLAGLSRAMDWWIPISDLKSEIMPPNNCSESVIKDLGLVGAAKGWRVLAGGFASGLKPGLADLIATDLMDAEAIGLAERVLDWYKQADKKSGWAG